MLTAFIAYQVFVSAGIAGLLVVITGISILLWLVSMDVNNHADITNTKALIRINREELSSLDHQFAFRFDGSRYADPTHAYANDIDLFGPASLFQWMNRCATEQGRDLLAHELLHHAPLEMIRQRHDASLELQPMVDWRQQLQGFALQTTVTRETEQRTKTWLEKPSEHFVQPVWKWIVGLYSVLTLGSAAAAMAGYISASAFSSLFVVYLLVANGLSRQTVKSYAALSGIVKEVGILQQLVQWTESRPFHSDLLQQLQTDAKGGGKSAAGEIRELKNILDRFDLRLNLAGPIFLNSFLLWDVRQMIALNEWKKKNKTRVPHWFHLLAETELLSTLATLRFNHPRWTVPEFSEKPFVLETISLGHPLIPGSNRVDNDFTLEGRPRIGLITGSNMAGKSTFLRSLGVNMVLAQMGAVVCATKYVLSPARLISSMRIADNLAESTSTFYAELKKLKTIIEGVNRREPLFILLDEILRGTNSFDRHAGSEALIAQLIRQQAVAVIATHDVELGALEKAYGGMLENYHFDVQVEGEELYFDYRLKEGICRSMNASILMKKIGIELSS